MNKLKFIILLLYGLLFCACNTQYLNNGDENQSKQPPLFENLIITNDGSVTYNGLTSGISTVDDVVSTMNGTGLMKQDGDKNPYFGNSITGELVYEYVLVPEAKHNVNFIFTDDNVIDQIDISVRDTPVGEFIDAYGEPNSILFSIYKRFNKKSCGMMMLYDEHYITAHFGKGLVSDKCVVSQNTTIGNIHIYSDRTYDIYKDEFLGQYEMEIPGTLDDYLFSWRGYGNMIELYPDYLFIEKQ